MPELVAPVRILVLGASGCLGQAVCRALARLPNTVPVRASRYRRAGYIHLDYHALVEPAAWVKLLTERQITAVVNCVGMWSGPDQAFEHAQFALPSALFRACAEKAIRVVHLSALNMQADSPVCYASTKARAEAVLLQECPTGVLIKLPLVFSPAGTSSRFFMGLAALPIQIDWGFARNNQPVHEDDVARAVVQALTTPDSPQVVTCGGRSPVTILEYLEALRRGMGLRKAWLTLKCPPWLGERLFKLGALLRTKFVNDSTWALLKSGAADHRPHPDATPYLFFATPADATRVRHRQLYWAARLSMAALWIWTAIVSLWGWPHSESLHWLAQVWAPLGHEFWLVAASGLDLAMGVLSLGFARKSLWKSQMALVAGYSCALLVALPEFALHPLGPLSKNLPVLTTLAYLALAEKRNP